MSEIRTAQDGKSLEIISASGPPLPIHTLWLRERVNTAENIDPVTGQRLYNPADLDPGLGIIAITTNDDASVSITFTDGVTGHFAAADILQELPYTTSPAEPAPIPWTTEAQPPAPVKWPSCDHDVIRIGVLRDFLEHGYIVFNNVPSQPGAVLDVARRFGYPRETNFGVLFDVRSIPSATDLAYTSLPLDPHTDNPYRHPVPGIQLLHCLTNQTTGGLSTLVDGLAVAETLREQHPDFFTSLTQTPIQFRYTDAETELVASAPIIELNAAGRFAAIHYSPRLDFVPLLPAAQLQSFFAARAKLDTMLKSSAFERRFRLDDGDLMMFDNRRLLHGRTGFDPQTGLRHLQGCYIDMDGPRSQFRVLHRRLS